jgi:signal transduction histidine kinase
LSPRGSSLMRRRLSLTIFLAVLGSLAVFAFAVSLAWWWNAQARDSAFEERLAGEVAAEILPVADEGPEALRRALERWHRRARIDLTVLDEEQRVVAWAGRRLVEEAPPGPSSGPGGADPGRSQRGRQWTFEVEMPDGRRLLARPQRMRPGPRPVSPFLALGLLMLAGAVVAWPISRRITQRLERLQRGVDQQGAGDLAARVAVEGGDEVAALARSFNQSAARIEDLVARQEALLASQKRLLANASHELRSPLARIRMAMELLLTGPQDHDKLAAELRRNIAELDQLVDEILLASRLGTSAPARDDVDLAGLAAEEASRVGAQVTVAREPAEETGPDDASHGAPSPQAMSLIGDSRLLRRMLRNLLENAGRYAASSDEPITVALRRRPASPGRGDEILLEVLDRGPGVPPEAREKIFEAFYRVEGHSEQAGGVGLGLSLVKQIAEAHGGSVACDAREGGGSRFLVRLPAESGEARGLEAEAAQVAALRPITTG